MNTMLFRRMAGVLVLAVFCAASVKGPETFASDVAVRQMDATPPDEEDTLKEEDLSGDIDKKLDMAIKVLQVIKEEVKEEKEEEAALAKKKTDATEQEKIASRLGRWLARINRVWKKLKESTEEEGAPAGGEDEELIDERAISDKLGQAIEMMSAIKTEFDKEAEKDK